VHAQNLPELLELLGLAEGLLDGHLEDGHPEQHSALVSKHERAMHFTLFTKSSLYLTHPLSSKHM
jgi:hypothetical protein